MKKRNLIAPSLLAILMSASLIGGATYSLFTSESNHDITVSSGKVSLTSTINNDFTYYTGDPAKPSYTSKEHFENGGVGSIIDNNLVLTRITPLDTFEFKIDITNESTVSAKYRVKMTCTDGFDLYGQLKLNDINTQWATIEPSTKSTSLTVQVSFPDKDSTVQNDFQNSTTKMNVTVEAVQGNAPLSYDTNEQVKINETITKPKEDKDMKLATSNGAVSVNVPKNSIDSEASNLSLNVNDNIGADKEKFTEHVDQSVNQASYYDIDVTGKKAEEPVNVSLYAGKNLKSVKVLHLKSNNQVETLPSNYNQTTGFVSFDTKTFSSFAVVSQKEKIVVNTTNDTVSNGDNLRNAITSAPTDSIINLTSGTYKLSKYLSIKGKNITLIGEGENTFIDDTDDELFFLSRTKENLTLKNLRIRTAAKDSKFSGGAFTVPSLYQPTFSELKNTDINSYSHILIDNVTFEQTYLGNVYSSKNPAVLTNENGFVRSALGPSTNAVVLGNNKYRLESSSVMTSKLLFNKEVTLENDMYFGTPQRIENGLEYNTIVYKDTNSKLNLNGHKIVSAQDTITENYLPKNGFTLFTLQDNANLEICGNGIIDTGHANYSFYGFNLNGTNSKLTITDSKFIGSPTAIQVQTGELVINGGSLEINDTAKKLDPTKSIYLINCLDSDFESGKAVIKINGGTFVDFNPADTKSEPTQPLSFVTEGHKVVSEQHGEETWYTVVPKVK